MIVKIDEELIRSSPLKILLIVIFLLTVFSTTSIVEAQLPELIVRVVDPSGNPLERIEVTITKGTESYRFITNTTGYAIFSGLSEGTYILQAKLDKVIIAEATIDFPKETSKTIVANISNVEIKLVDLDKKPVPSAQIRLLSKTRIAEYNAVTNEEGIAILNKIPYTLLNDIKGYDLTISVGGYTILHITDLEINQPVQKLEYTLELLSLNITALNMEGEQISRVNVKLQAGNYTKTMRTDKGVARFIQIPSSNIEWVGEYTLNVTYTIGRVEYTVYSSKRKLVSSQSMDLVLELGSIEVTVLDEEGKPLRNFLVSLSNQKSQNFTQQQTDEDGRVIFVNMPLSRGVAQAGEYIIQVYRLNKKMSEVRIDHSSAKSSVTMKIAKSSISLFLRDYSKQPLVEYNVSLVDLDSGDQYTGITDINGEMLLKIFPGRYRIEVYKDDTVFYKGELNIFNNSLTMDIEKINFPLAIKIIDAFGNAMRTGEMIVKLGGHQIYSGPIDAISSITVPHVGFITVDVRISGNLIWRETIFVDGPREHIIRLTSYVTVLGNILPLETLALIVSVMFSLLLVTIGGLIIHRSRKRRLITR
ncbi:MAG: carboxypeptidase-like regulatory domain-containing protein [Thaumarchaeota archaeon]|jgi:5-hydroxyisourate hydrolase-like protein (transthyretin family)|nr:carboxypeptidase-like regulatory domain-containing protein [Candidatus Geocrenenecus arthurdayi]MCL7391408.1 carboxypeptidase-like regulatory domain-containing protein [Candidatus Geocrenenecus arthurdayi]MCL7397108.1 carboxypeptidase-like regulatory domain-containing protein [Candidatus Geocrenenecus arthurdayi]MCL7402832.1 carboxypeptidase-like regulatory domain-containing protein [Candidatus Geocrenenecus arthurdayi]